MRYAVAQGRGRLTGQDFVSSVLTLSTVRQGTSHLRKRIGELDGQMGDVGRALGEKVSVFPQAS
jgi:hypothetical protein